MQIIITQQPEALLTSDDDIVRQSLALDGTDRDAQVDQLLLSAQAELDGPKGKLGFSVAEQSVELIADSFDCPPIRLPGGPIVDGSVVVTYLDADAAEQTLDSTTYVVGADGTLTLSDGGSWPDIADQSNAVTVAYDVGISNVDDPRIAQMKTAIILHARANLDISDDHGEAARKAVTEVSSTLWDPAV